MFNLSDGLNKNTNYSLAFIAGLTRATEEGSLLEIAQYSPYYLILPLNVYCLQGINSLHFILKVYALGQGY